MNHFAVRLKLTQHCKSTIFQFKKKREKKLVVSLSPQPHTIKLIFWNADYSRI